MLPGMMPATVFSIDPGAPFLETFVAECLGGRIVEGFPGDSGPLALAGATIYVPTRRAARALAQEIARQSPHDGTLLPRIKPLGALDESEIGLQLSEALHEFAPWSEMPRAASDLERRCLLSQLVLAWGRSLGGAIRSVDSQGRLVVDATVQPLVAANPVEAWRLAGALADLIDEMTIEDIAWDGLKPLAQGLHDDYWRITLDFLNIAMEAWPRMQDDGGFVDPAQHRAQLIDRECARLLDGANRGPVIAIGSTGTNRATARLLAAVARAPRGAVVLPGLDTRLDEAGWSAVAAIGRTDGADSADGHPQAALRRLLRHMNIERSEVKSCGAAEPRLAARAAFVSQALRPADTTDAWPSWRQDHGDDPFLGVSLIEAADEREEALAIALVLRECLETPGATAALVTPDRDLAHRVRCELARWSIEADESGGETLASTPVGILARRLTAAAFDSDPLPLLALVQHPLFSLGRSREEADALAQLYELGALRSGAPLAQGRATQIAEARKAAASRHAHEAHKRIGAEQWTALGVWLEDVDACLAPLRADAGEAPLSQWMERHRLALLAALPPSAGGDGAAELARLFDEGIAAGTRWLLDGPAYLALFDMLARETSARSTRPAHPRLKILGLLEARLLPIDCAVLGGLDETVWPPAAQSDAFLSRPMRASIGLSPPERRIGQTAHDFTQAMGAPRVVLARTRRRADAPAVTSRFLLRMQALARPDHWAAMKTRGERWLQLARRIETANPVARAPRPQPRPAVHLRPVSLSVTEIETLIRDPYAIFARRVLRLRPLPALDPEPGPREQGNAIHAALAKFTLGEPPGPHAPGARDRLLASMMHELAPHLQDASFAAFQWPRILAGVDAIVRFDGQLRRSTVASFVECRGALVIALDDGSDFTLTGIADRIDLDGEGRATVIDYKTGAVPTAREIQANFSPQLTLEAAMLRRGAFPMPASGIATARLRQGRRQRQQGGAAGIRQTSPRSGRGDRRSFP